MPDIKEMRSINAIPRSCADNALKTNAALLVSTEVEFKIIKQLTHLVILEIWGEKIGTPILCASCYLHQASGIESNLQLLAEISSAISSFR